MSRHLQVVLFVLCCLFATSCHLPRQVKAAKEFSEAAHRMLEAERTGAHIDYENDGTVLLYNGAVLLGKTDDVDLLIGLMEANGITSLSQLSMALHGDISIDQAYDLVKALLKGGIPFV